MEKISIQLYKDYSARLDNFVDAVCGEQHLDNYYAAISVAVHSAVDFAMDSGADVATLAWGHSARGTEFVLRTAEARFASVQAVAADLATSVEAEKAFLLTTLADEVSVEEEGRALRLSFAVRGIDPHECAARIATLQRFYQPALVEA